MKVRKYLYLLLIAIITSIIISGTFARYTVSKNETADGYVANWSFAVNGLDNEKITSANIVDGLIVDEKIAPGSEGDFKIGIDLTGCEVAVEYKIKIYDIENKPDNFYFYTDDTYEKKLDKIEDAYELTGIIKTNEPRLNDIRLYWKWDYEIVDGDVIDTEIGKNIEQMSFNVKIIGTQYKEVDINATYDELTKSINIKVNDVYYSVNSILLNGEAINFTVNQDGTVEANTGDMIIKNRTYTITVIDEKGYEKEISLEVTKAINEKEYTVQYYIKGPDGDYQLREEENFVNIVGTIVTAEIKEYEFYVNIDHENQLLSGIVDEEEILILKVYYDPIKYTIAYNGNGSTSGNMSSSIHEYNSGKQLTANAYVREYTVIYNHNYSGSTNVSKKAAYTFKGWSTSEDGEEEYEDNTIVMNLKNTSGIYNLYAVWEEKNIIYIPKRTGYAFHGWYEDAACTIQATDEEGVYIPNKNITLYAKWIDASTIYATLYSDGTLEFTNQSMKLSSKATTEDTLENTSAMSLLNAIVDMPDTDVSKEISTFSRNIQERTIIEEWNISKTNYSSSVESVPWNSLVNEITTVNFKTLVAPISTARWFQGCKNLMNINNIKNLDTTNVTNMSYMFMECVKLTSIDLSNFNTSKVTNMSYMFRMPDSGGNLQNIIFGKNFNTSNVTTMRCIFYNCTNLENIDVSNFNTSLVTDSGWMFYYCKKLKNINVSNFNTSKVTNMKSMFCGCNSLTSLNLSSFDTSNVTDMSYMFNECSSLTSITYGSSFHITKVTNAMNVYDGCSNLSVYNAFSNATTASLGSYSTGTIGAKQMKVYSYTPSTSTTYAFCSDDSSASSKSTDSHGLIFTGSIDKLNLLANIYNSTGTLNYLRENALYENDDGGQGYNFGMFASLTSGTTYYFVVIPHSSSNSQAFSPVYITTEYRPSISKAFTTTGYDNYYSISGGSVRAYTFTAPSSRSYKFYSTGSVDTYGCLFSDMSETEFYLMLSRYSYYKDKSYLTAKAVAYDDDSGTNNNYSFTYSCTSGQKYYYVTIPYNANDGVSSSNYIYSRIANG